MRYRLLAAAAIIATSGHASAQSPGAFAIADNSFLVEEAFNQEKGVVQNILVFQRPEGGEWLLEFTQEWPVFGQTHQFSYTIPWSEVGIGELMLNWRVQARSEDAGGPAISPRLSLILPTGDDDSYEAGVQFNVPVSKQFGDVYIHANGGGTLERVVLDERVSLLTPHAALGVIYRALPMVHLMAEGVVRGEESLQGGGCCSTTRNAVVLVSPGVRAGINLGEQQLVFGAAAPITVHGPGNDGLLLYLSYELPFMRNR